jgi:hypothetical protein
MLNHTLVLHKFVLSMLFFVWTWTLTLPELLLTGVRESSPSSILLLYNLVLGISMYCVPYYLYLSNFLFPSRKHDLRWYDERQQWIKR